MSGDSEVNGVRVRDAEDHDMAAVQEIYAHHVLNGLASFEEKPPSLDEMHARRDAIRTAGLPYVVAEQCGHGRMRHRSRAAR